METEALLLVYPDVKVRWYRVAEDMRRLHQVEIFPIEGHRSFKRQEGLFAQGREFRDGRWIVVDASKIVTNSLPGSSWHAYGLAIDSGFKGDPYLTKLDKHSRDFLFAELGFFYRLHGFTWGGDWNGNGIEDKNDFDRPHGQRTYGQVVSQIRALHAHGGLLAVWTFLDKLRGSDGSDWAATRHLEAFKVA